MAVESEIGFGFDPFGEVVNGGNDVSVSTWCSAKRTHHVDADELERALDIELLEHGSL